MKDKDFYTSQKLVVSQSKLKSFLYRDKKIIECLSRLDMLCGVLDIGERNPLTRRIEREFGIDIDNTVGDLDEDLITNGCYFYYDVIVFSHVIEHIFNPLLCLENIKERMESASTLVICTPIKPHFLTWGKGHFHEFDEYRFRKLIERAELKITRWEKFSNYRWNTLRSYTGIRPFIRMFFKEQSYVELKK